MIPSDWIDLAARRLDGQVSRTPLCYDPELDLYLKWENRQITGSFKIRGALNKVLSLERWEQQRGLVTASAGNHGQGVAVAGQRVDAPVTVFASDHAVPKKVEAMRALGADVRLVPGGYDAAERTAITYAGQHDATWVSPYNDEQVIAGQATLALELLDQMAPKPPSTVIVPVGGGGLAAGIGAALDAFSPQTKLIGVQSVASPFFYELYHHNSQEGVMELDSLADGLAGPVEEGSMTIAMLHALADDMLLVTESQIAQAVAYAWRRHGEKIEGSAAVTLAVALCRIAVSRPAVAIISGGNIQPEVHARICEQWNGPPGASRSDGGF